MHNSALNILGLALRFKRPDGSQAIKDLIKALLALAPDASQTCVDQGGNLWIDHRLGTSRTLFTAHLDTVHKGPGESRLLLRDNVLSTDGTDVLGADDGAGVAMLAELLVSGVPGLYLFTQGEEIGGIGATKIVDHEPERLAHLDRCIAFDRRGTKDICGEQFIGNCASEAFVDELAARLDMGHTWAAGSYTDNCEYRGIIPEIVNISVGYEREHTCKETLDMDYLKRLAAQAVLIDWESLPVVGPVPDLIPAYSHGWGNWPTDRRLYPLDVDDEETTAINETVADICHYFGSSAVGPDSAAIRDMIETLLDDIAFTREKV